MIRVRWEKTQRILLKEAKEDKILQKVFFYWIWLVSKLQFLLVRKLSVSFYIFWSEKRTFYSGIPGCNREKLNVASATNQIRISILKLYIVYTSQYHPNIWPDNHHQWQSITTIYCWPSISTGMDTTII